MSHPSNNNTNHSIPFHANNPKAASGGIRSSKNNNLSSSSNKQINRMSSPSHQTHNAHIISSLRQTHQSITPTPLRQNTTAASLSQIKQPVTAASSTAPFAQHKKNTSSSSLRQIDGISINTTAPSPPSSSQNSQNSKSTSTSSNTKSQTTNSPQPTNTNNKQTPKPNYSTPKKSSKRPYVDTRYDPNLTLAQRLEASTDLPLAPYSDYKWKMENEYESLTSWQPPVRKSEEWKWKGP